MKCQKVLPKVTYSNYLFYSTDIPKPKYIQFTIRYDGEKQQIITFEKLEPGNVWKFDLKNDHNNLSRIKIVP